jgi:uncharacterized protein (DUF885 family)
VKVLQALEHKTTIQDPKKVMELYRETQKSIESAIQKNHLLTLPAQPVIARASNEAEEAIMPVPHVNTPHFIDNNGSIRPEFVLCDLKAYGNPVVAYALMAHEGRPGHDLQFSRMLDQYLAGQNDLIQNVVAMNSVNCEGWAHYAEYLMYPHCDNKAAQLSAIREQLLRTARMFLDPELNLGRLTFDQVKSFIRDQVGFTESVAQSEAERYSFLMPAQATTYRYGCVKIMELRDQLRKELGEKFNLKKFHDSLISFGLMPLDKTKEFIRDKMLDS